MKISKNRGFTLLEILIVVFIIGIVLSLVSLTIAPSEGRALSQEAKRIYLLMEMTREEAILNTQEMAFAVTGEGYAFQKFSAEGWQSLEDDSVLKERTLPEQIRMDLSILGEEVDLAGIEQAEAEAQEGEEAEVSVLSRIFFLSSGEVTPFELFLHYETEEDGMTIVGNELGELELKEHKVTL